MSTPSIPSTLDLKKLTREKAEVYLEKMLDEYMEIVRTDGDVEDVRKAVVVLLDITGWRAPPEKDPNANLPVTNIRINLGNAGTKSISLALGEPSPMMLESLDVNSEIIDVD